MGVIFIAVIACAASLILARRANARFHAQRRLPMQWWLNGDVTWSAPRAVALSFIPVLGVAMLAFITVLSLTTGPRAGQEHLVIPIAIVVAIVFLGAQQLHLVLIDRTLRDGRGW